MTGLLDGAGAFLSAAAGKAASALGSSGSSHLSARADHYHPTGFVTPEDYGYVGWTVDPVLAAGTIALGTGNMVLARVKIPKTGTISNVIVTITTGGTSLTAGLASIYDLTGAQLGVSADQATSWQSSGTKTVALTSPTASQLAGTTVLVAVLAVGTTGPTLRAVAAAGSLNQGLSAATGLRMSILSSQTTAPASITLSSASSNTSLPLLFLS